MLDYFLDSNILQESINITDILNDFLTDHSPIFHSLPKNMGISRGKGLWKFSKSLCDKSNFVSKLKYHLKVISNTMSSEKITAEQLFRSEVYKI